MSRRPAPLPELPPPQERKALRKAVGWTITDAASDLKVSRVTFRKWERGESKPHPDNHRRYAALLRLFRYALRDDEIKEEE